jgi:hypothetical protein
MIEHPTIKQSVEVALLANRSNHNVIAMNAALIARMIRVER